MTEIPDRQAKQPATPIAELSPTPQFRRITYSFIVMSSLMVLGSGTELAFDLEQGRSKADLWSPTIILATSCCLLLVSLYRLRSLKWIRIWVFLDRLEFGKRSNTRTLFFNEIVRVEYHLGLGIYLAEKRKYLLPIWQFEHPELIVDSIAQARPEAMPPELSLRFRASRVCLEDYLQRLKTERSSTPLFLLRYFVYPILLSGLTLLFLRSNLPRVWIGIAVTYLFLASVIGFHLHVFESAKLAKNTEKLFLKQSSHPNREADRQTRRNFRIAHFILMTAASVAYALSFETLLRIVSKH